MSLQHLRTFVEVYRQQSISAASRSLGMTQPAVSQHIASLEVAIGRPLFERHVKGVMALPAADDLAADVGDKLDAAEAALSSARARSAAMTGAVRIIGHVDFLAEAIVPQMLPMLETGMRVYLNAGSRDAIRHALVEGDCDLGISAYPLEDQRLRVEKIRSERVLAVAAPDVSARILSGPDLSEQLANEPVIAYNLDRPLIDNWLSRNGLSPIFHPPAFITQDLRMLRDMLCQGFGWSALPEYICKREIATGQLIEIPAPGESTTNDYHLVWAPSALRNPRIALVRQTLMWRLNER